MRRKAGRKRVEEYVELRRSLGFKLVDAKVGLIKYALFLQPQGAVRITIPLAMEWAQQDKTARPAEWAKRVSFVRGFARHCWSAHDSQTEVPPSGLLPHRPGRAHLYLYSNEEIGKLLQAARRLPSTHGLRGRTYYCLLGLLAAPGRRPSSYLGVALGWMALRSGARFTHCRGRSGCAALLIVMGHGFTIFAIDLLLRLWSSGIGPVMTWSAACPFCRSTWDMFTWPTPIGT
ncbi:MAG TPA: hypothetical protein VHZ07_08195 [Bryobacteraceae bacterium]|nr:hypothetical protein [Bryobacteraceae bacterium]